MRVLERFRRLKTCLYIQDFVSNQPWALKTSVSRKTIFSDDTSCVNFIVVWNELAKSIKLLISALGKVHTEKMSSINLFQMGGLYGLVASGCFSMCAIKMTSEATASLRIGRMRSPSDGVGCFKRFIEFLVGDCSRPSCIFCLVSIMWM